MVVYSAAASLAPCAVAVIPLAPTLGTYGRKSATRVNNVTSCLRFMVSSSLDK